MEAITFHYMHYRYDTRGMLRRYYRGRSPWSPKGKGGLTICVVTTDTGLIGVGEGACSLSDAFCYRTGREIAREKAEREVWYVDEIQEDEECENCEGCDCA